MEGDSHRRSSMSTVADTQTGGHPWAALEPVTQFRGHTGFLTGAAKATGRENGKAAGEARQGRNVPQTTVGVF